MSILSEDIVTSHILTRLPVKSVIRFRCVCKSWMYLLSDHNSHFITSHIMQTSQNPNYECLVMSLYPDTSRSIMSLLTSDCINIMSRSRLSYSRVNNAPQHHDIIGSVNGLVCVFYQQKFLLWNPVTVLGKTISPPDDYWNGKFYGLGWDHLENEYKVVVCYFKEQKSLHGVIYSSKSDSWSVLVVPDAFFGKVFVPRPAVIVKGCPYWTSRDELWTADGGYGGFVAKFECGSNQFTEFVLPAQISRRDCYSVVNVKDRLVVLAYYHEPGTRLAHVFHLDEECGDWSKTYTFEPIHEPYSLSKFLLCFKYGGEFVCNNGNSLYDPKTNGIKVIGNGHRGLRSGYSYTPSLVFIPGMEPVHTQSHWRAPEAERTELRPTQSHLRLLFGKYFKCLCWR